MTSPSSNNGMMVGNSSDYLDIDVISDTDIAAHPSSPFRSPSKPSPKATLEFNRPPPPIATILILPAPLTAKQLQAEWPTIPLSPRFTETIRSTPPSSDHKNPTRHERILLYDPIVLEDLTAWLNAHGLRIEVGRCRIKGKKKAGTTHDTVELGQEEPQSWMVQEWC